MQYRIREHGIPLLLGALCFMISQALLRMPLLNRLQSSTNFSLWYMMRPYLVLFLLSFSAGLFEEGFRHLFRRFLLRKPVTLWKEPVLFGLGHGLAEVLYLLIPAWHWISPGTMVPALAERFFAVLIHIGLTVTVWNGFQLGKPWRYLLLAITVHGCINLLATTLQARGLSVWTVEGVIGIISALCILYAMRSRRYYPKGGIV